MRRLLLVDDSKAVREALQAALEPYGFDLVDAENGAVALQLLCTSRFDLAFVDLNMPVLDGPSLVRLMRARRIDTRVVLVTSGADTQVVTSTIKAGASDYVAKPFTPELIREVTGRVLGLDPASWVASSAEVIVQHPHPPVSTRLRGSFPTRVRVWEASTLAATLALAEEKAPSLVLLDERVLDGDVVSAAELVRRAAPRAGIFALVDGTGEDRAWSPQGALDGVLPVHMADVIVRGFLYALFLRPLVFGQRGALRAAGFEGEERFHAAYFAVLARALGARATLEDQTQDLLIDLTSVPPTAEARLAALLGEVKTELDALGAAPTFRVPERLVAPLRARPELARVVILGPE